MKVLVVGASGYLGGAVCARLERAGHEVIGLSRSGGGPARRTVRGDVTRPSLALAGDALDEVRAEATHIVTAFGSVDWDAGPAEALDLHAAGVRNVLALARGCERFAGLVHVSSLLALGRASGRVGNRELYVGQTFRNWYEYGKYAAEGLVRAARDVPSTNVRFGPLLGVPAQPGTLSARHGLLAAVRPLLQGYPVHLRGGGEFPCYPGEVTGAAEVVGRAVEAPAAGATWTWFDPDDPTLADVLRAVCRPLGRVPRIVDSAAMGRLQRALASRAGVPPALLGYAEPWFDLDPAVLDAVPGGPPRCPAGYLEATGREVFA
ncbi:NAD-dependent epimerase/dehydratase family protein [Actinomadura bangladeshensis]|uniref:NAD-dependent epimerase/dehydratase family protein n=1 Tax=Actinomadura bangladeshensis TaxID=453573 RepID=A0A6L9QUY8_9ACTN|nr:NAD-dependent epimerase/dehydratase family protein [Actinomadura bangladeshensis]NEA29350.1 NAD-dependent epimerase/dehydratase family protein [Actinomadura bangladeshensis]